MRDRARTVGVTVASFTVRGSTGKQLSRATSSRTSTKSGFGKIQRFTQFPTDRKCEVCRMTFIKKKLRAEPQIPMFLTRSVNREIVTGMPCWYKTWPLNSCNRIRAKQRLLRKRRRVYESFSIRQPSPKVIYPDNSFGFGKVWVDLSWNHCTSTPHRFETNGIAERARRVTEGHSRYFCNLV